MQLLSLTKSDLNQVLNHMGHTWDVHKDFYRQYDPVGERLDVAKLLMLQDQNKLNDYRDKNLAGITNAASVLDGLVYLAPVRPGQTLCLRDDGQRRLLGLHSLALQALTVLLLVPFVYSVVWHDSCVSPRNYLLL